MPAGSRSLSAMCSNVGLPRVGCADDTLLPGGEHLPRLKADDDADSVSVSVVTAAGHWPPPRADIPDDESARQGVQSIVPVFVEGEAGMPNATYEAAGIITFRNVTVAVASVGCPYPACPMPLAAYGAEPIVVKRSTDSGRHWSGPILVNVTVDSPANIGGGAVIVADTFTGHLLLVWTRQPGQCKNESKVSNCRQHPAFSDIRVSVSTDLALSWEPSYSALPPGAGPVGIGSYGQGICISKGPHKGRLLVQAYDAPPPPGDKKNKRSNGFFYYSDAHGAAGSWKATKPISQTCVEQSAVELFSPPAPEGRLMVNCRGYPAYRSSLLSDSGGLTWGNFTVLKDLEGPGVKGGTAKLPDLGCVCISISAISISAPVCPHFN
eukprot:SAG22_NODE_410_length_10907_cov_2.597520_1_plen_380_part_10